VGPVRNPVLSQRVTPCFPWFLVCVYYCSSFDKAVHMGGGESG